MTELEKSKPEIGNIDQSGVKRSLQGRHLQMIAIGGTIGTGLFLKSGSMILDAGPLGALFAYLIAGIAVFCVVMSLGEMATLIPISGSFNSYAERFVDPALGFTAGWSYCYQWIMTLPVEVQACSFFLQYWFKDVNEWYFIIVIILVLLALNVFTVKGYGETEYWLSLLKVLAIVVFIIVGVYVIFRDNMWFNTYSQPAAFSTQGPVMIFGSMVSACFAFGGTELVGITAGEAANPRKSVPRAINGTFWRIMIFYVVSIFLVGMICSADYLSALYKMTDSKLLRSPFVIAFTIAKIPYADHIMNAIAFIAVFSAGNSSIYAASRTMMSLCQSGQGPAFLGIVVNNGIFNGVPIPAVLTVTTIGSLSFLGLLIPDVGGVSLFDWLVNLIGLTIIFTWMFISITHIRFRAAYLAQGYKLEDLPYKSSFGVYADYVGIAVMSIVIILSGTFSQIFFGAEFVFVDFLTNYIGIIPYPFLYFGYKLLGKNAGMVPLHQVDLQTGHISNYDVEEEVVEESTVKKWINFLA
ncbi:hypothetical protein HDV03_000287 [Kappamyces sp. JEL0829]|nr:hypothetical protein HDV03_000287 [Kappamyces sp. JEL0829]